MYTNRGETIRLLGEHVIPGSTRTRRTGRAAGALLSAATDVDRSGLFQGDGRRALHDLAGAYDDLIASATAAQGMTAGTCN